MRTQVKSILAKLEVTSQLAAVGLAHSISWQRPVGLRPSAPRRPSPDLPHLRHVPAPSFPYVCGHHLGEGVRSR